VDSGAHPRVFEPDIPEFVRHPAKNPRVRAPIRPPGSLGPGRFTQAEGTSVGWLTNGRISGAGTVGQGAKTMGSYSTGETDEGGAIPGGDGRAGGEGLGDGGCRAVGPPAEEIVQAAHGGRRDGARVVRENVERVHSSMLPSIARAAGQGRRVDGVAVRHHIH